MRARHSWVAVGVVAIWLGGCSVRVYSPPTGSFPVESSASLGQGKNSVRGDIFWGGALFGPPVSSYRLSAARGLTDTVDVSLSPTLTRILGARRGDENHNIGALRAGIKYAPVPHFAVVGGLGAGGSEGGSFLSPDLGFVAAYENPYVIPFFTLRGLLSAPLRAKAAHFTTDDDADRSDEDNQRDVYALAPRFTWGFQAGAGLRVPLLRAWVHGALRPQERHTERHLRRPLVRRRCDLLRLGSAICATAVGVAFSALLVGSRRSSRRPRSRSWRRW
jgi:hypothetical protein